MKRLYVLRHAKSSWSHPELSDFERPLNRRGRKAAPFMGGLLVEYEDLPEVVISSPAVRARQTAELFMEAGGLGAGIEFDQRIYGAGANTLIGVLEEIDDLFGSSMIVGHNPGFEDLVRLLTGKYEDMPTAAIAVIDLEIDRWIDIGGGCGTLIDVLRPKERGMV